MSRPATFEVTVAGTRWANLNGPRGNHHAHQALMDEWKHRGILAIRHRPATFVDAPVTITATVRRTTKARADAHNVTPTIKALIDAAVACGVIEDDNDGIVKRLIIEAGPTASTPTVVLRIEAS